jgi:hypothetical protein
MACFPANLELGRDPISGLTQVLPSVDKDFAAKHRHYSIGTRDIVFRNLKRIKAL